MNTQKKKYEKPRLAGEKLFEAVAVACCKGTTTCGTSKVRKNCGAVAPKT